MKPKPNWPADRKRELMTLQELIAEAEKLESANYAPQRMMLCSKLARKIGRGDINSPRASLMQFLIEEANKPKGQP